MMKKTAPDIKVEKLKNNEIKGSMWKKYHISILHFTVL